MKILDRLKAAGKALRSGEWWMDYVGRNAIGSSGVSVNQKTAQNYSPVFACVSLASETVSTLPLGLYEKTKEGRRPREDHPVYKILHDKANSAMSAQTFRETMQWNCELRGVALAKKIRNGYKQVVELWPLSPDAIESYYTDPKTGKLFLKQADKTILSQDDVFYFYGPGSNGIQPQSRITLAAESLSVGIAAEEYGRRYFGEGTNIGGFLRHDKKLSPEAFERLKTDVNKKYKGLQKSHGLIILEEGMEYQKVGLTNNDSQFLETRRFQVEEVCRWFGMKPHMIADLSHATFSNIEHQGIEAVRYCWRPRCVRWEQAINTQLLGGSGLYAEHNLDGLMRGDLPSQAEAWHSLIQDGVLNADEVRKMLNMDPQEGGQGKIYFMPLNMIDKSTTPQDQGTQDSGDPDPALPPPIPRMRKTEKSLEKRRIVDHRRRISESFRGKYRTLAKKIVEKDAGLLRSKLQELETAAFVGWLASDYIGEISETIREDAKPIFTAFAMALLPVVEEEVGTVESERYESFVDSYVDSFSTRYGARTKTKIVSISNETEEPREDIEKQIDSWGDERADDLQREEITRQRSAFVKAAYIAAGVTKLRWITTGKNCPFCDMLDGKIVGIREYFQEKGSSLAPEGKAPLVFSHSIGHAPAHVGCDCDIIAEV